MSTDAELETAMAHLVAASGGKRPYRRGHGCQIARGVLLNEVTRARAHLSHLVTLSEWRAIDVILHDDEAADSFNELLRLKLPTLPLWWVAPEMCDLLEHAAPSMPSQRLMPRDLSDPAGIVFFGHPVGAGDPAGEVSACAWYPMLVEDRWILTIDLFLYSYSWLPLGRSHWVFGQKTEDLRWGGYQFDGDDDDPDDIIQNRRRLFALWTLAQQSITVSRAEAPDRAERRRLERAGIEPSLVNVIRLRPFARNLEGSADGAVDRDYSHRWIVSGHWRNQYLPSHGTHRLQWIAPHVKGPGDKPLILKETVKAWVR